MGWSADDSNALFRAPHDRQETEEPIPAFDDSQEAMRRLRLPFEANPADVIEQQHTVTFDEDEHRD